MMPSPVKLGQALLWLLLSSTAPKVFAAEQTAAWVSIDESGHPKTLTPVLSTANGLPTIVSNAAPYEITATVFTKTNHGFISVSTGTPGVYSAISGGSNGAGAFPLCRAEADAKTPICMPKENSALNPGITYYITWDPTYLKNATNTTVSITTTYLNATSSLPINETITPTEDDGKIPMSRGFYAWPVGWQILELSHSRGTNVTLTLTTTTHHLNQTTVRSHPGLVVLVEREKPFENRPTPKPAGPEIYIGLPVVFGFIIIVLFGTFFWNRNARHIDLRALMNRRRGTRAGGGGLGRYQKLGVDDNDHDDDDDDDDGARSSARGRRRQKDDSVRLMKYDGDEVESGRSNRHHSVDSLGSLTGSPVGHPRKRHGN